MSGIYKLLVVLHILSVVVGIGATMLNGLYAAKAKQAGGPAAGAIMKANFDVTMVAEKVIYLIPVFGILAVLASDDVWEFDQTWIWLSLVLYVVALGIAHGNQMPAGKKMLAGPSSPQEAEALGKRLAMGGMALNLLVVVLVALMVWKPGV
jgi:uncharacterized membrane protein